jgi:hypothetical protein
MIKKAFFTLLFLSVTAWVSAQSLQFELNGHVYEEGETIQCNTPTEWGEYLQDMQIRNLTSQDWNVLVKKEVIEDLEGVSNYFCWGLCFGPDTYVSPNPVAVPANSITAVGALSFHAMFEDNVFGKVQVKYSAYDERHPEDAVTINVVFHKSGEGVHEVAAVRFGQAYPNPASSVVNFDYNVNPSDKVSVSVYNLLGQEVMDLPINTLQDRLSFSVSDLNDGIYFCNLFVNGCALKTEKFVVKK